MYSFYHQIYLAINIGRIKSLNTCIPCICFAKLTYSTTDGITRLESHPFYELHYVYNVYTTCEEWTLLIIWSEMVYKNLHSHCCKTDAWKVNFTALVKPDALWITYCSWNRAKDLCWLEKQSDKTRSPTTDADIICIMIQIGLFKRLQWRTYYTATRITQDCHSK